MDLLFDLPIPAERLAPRAMRIRIREQPVKVAAVEDLLELKKIGAADRHSPGDAEDIVFLEQRRKA